MENLQLLQLQEPCPEQTKVAVDDDVSTMSQKGPIGNRDFSFNILLYYLFNYLQLL